MVRQEQVRRERLVADDERHEDGDLRRATLRVALRAEVQRHAVRNRIDDERRVATRAVARCIGAEVRVVGRVHPRSIDDADLPWQEAVGSRIANERERPRGRYIHHRERREVDELELLEAADRQCVRQAIRHAVAGLNRQWRIGRPGWGNGLAVDRVNLLLLHAVRDDDARTAVVRAGADDRRHGGVDRTR